MLLSNAPVAYPVRKTFSEESMETSAPAVSSDDVPKVVVHCLIPPELYLVTNKSFVPDNVFPSKFPFVWPVM